MMMMMNNNGDMQFFLEGFLDKNLDVFAKDECGKI